MSQTTLALAEFLKLGEKELPYFCHKCLSDCLPFGSLSQSDLLHTLKASDYVIEQVRDSCEMISTNTHFTDCDNHSYAMENQ